MKTIPLTKNKTVKVSDKDFVALGAFHWCLQKSGDHFYAVRYVWENKKSTCIMMHRQIVGLPPGRKLLVDHRDRDGLNNQRRNLRIASHSQNAANANKHRNCRYPYRGVSGHHGLFQAYITVKKKYHFLGRFADPIQAAKVYDKAAIKFFGKFASLNFPKLKTKT
jgi:hypothetical protein